MCPTLSVHISQNHSTPYTESSVEIQWNEDPILASRFMLRPKRRASDKQLVAGSFEAAQIYPRC